MWAWDYGKVRDLQIVMASAAVREDLHPIKTHADMRRIRCEEFFASFRPKAAASSRSQYCFIKKYSDASRVSMIQKSRDIQKGH
jgi:hypothetical protein